MSDKKKLLENFMSLSLLQVFGYILPLLTLPYLLRVLGPDKYGMVAFAQSFVQIFIIFTDYGFNISATKEISIHKENKQQVSSIFVSVMVIKMAFMFVSLLLLLLLILSVPKLQANGVIITLSVGQILGSVLFPVWFFQGIEKMKYITLFNISIKFIYTLLIFVLVKQSSDYIYVPVINSIGMVLIGAVSIYFIFTKFHIHYKRPTIAEIRFQLYEGWHVFLSSIAVSLYTVSNSFILGMFTNNTIVAYYATAEKLINSANSLLSPITQTIFPHISQLVVRSQKEAIQFIKKASVLIGGFTLLGGLIIVIFASTLISLISGQGYEESVKVLRILSVIPLLVGLSNVFGVQTMVTFGYKKEFSRILISASLLNIMLALILVPLFHHIGTAVAVVLSEVFVTTTMVIFIYAKFKNRKRGLSDV